MAIKQIKLPVFNNTYYSYTVPLQGNQYTLEFLFIERAQSWFLSLLDSNDAYLVRNQRLTPNNLLFTDYKISEDLTGGFYFTPISEDVDPSLLVDSIATPKGTYKLLYVFNDGE